MTRQPNYRIRRAIYALNAIAVPLATYAYTKGLIGDLEVTLINAELAAALALAGVKATDR